MTAAKPGDLAIQLRHRDLPALDLLGWKVNGVGIGFEVRPVVFVRQRCSPLQRFEPVALLRARRT